MKMQKVTLTLLSAVLSVGMIAGCGNSTNGSATKSSNAPATDAPKKETATLTMWGGVPAESGPQAVVDAWNAKHPETQVKYERFVNDDAGNLKLDTALSVNQGVDLFVNYQLPILNRRVDAGYALDLSEFKEYNIDDKMGKDAASWKIKEKYYGMPTKKNISFVWMNKNMLDAAGLQMPALDWTLQDMTQYAAKLKADKRWGFVQHTAGYSNIMDGVSAGIGFTKADGTSNLDNADLKPAYEGFFNMMHTDKSMPPLGEQLTSKMPVDTMFLKGESAMLGAGEFVFRSANDLKTNPRSFKIAFATIPKASKDSKDYKYAGGLGDVISINAKSKYKQQAWEFLKWYADGGMMPLAAGGRIPSSKDVNPDEAIKLLLGANEATYDIDSLKKVVFGKFPTQVISLPSQVVDARREEYEKYFLKNQSLDVTLGATSKRHNEFLKQNKK
ncbi:ABC transporter substrate-binding protein [Paenibacillus sedimenti]|uniref:Extracellular solute-binding protein n=1 Tax=Paenibacillus sedimenti TaxID=2770274 RepID=A0A926QM57_9BACL|nr:extracellular solute-binding protein [Paenibacillus sedimenti]MBD0384340.1 extracellular solute-binding protein [Paenibacillus sedimenti]